MLAEQALSQVVAFRITWNGISSFALDPFIPNADKCTLLFGYLSLLVAEDIGVTSIEDGHGGATEELTAGGTELNLWEGKVSQ